MAAQAASTNGKTGWQYHGDVTFVCFIQLVYHDLGRGLLWMDVEYNTYTAYKRN